MKKNIFLSILVALLICTSSLFSGCFESNQDDDNNSKDNSYASILGSRLEQSIQLADSYLTNITNQNGMFIYEYNPVTNTTSQQNYNILRHAGTIYAMMKLYNETHDNRLLEAAKKAISYLTEQIRPYNESECIVYQDEVKLGGTALAIIALVEYTKVTDDSTYLPTLNKLGNYILLSLKPNGDFIHKRYYSTNETSDFVSEYYPGEAILALVRLYSLTSNQNWLNAAETATQYLIFERDVNASVYSIIHDHWLLIALNELYRYKENIEYYNHSKLITIAILAYQRDDFTRFSEETEWLGSYYTPPRSTPTATRTEGLVASYHLFKDYNANQSYLKRMLYSINLSIQFQLNMQYTAQTAQNMPHPSLAIGGFKNSFSEYTIRIDYVQHNICGILEFYHMLQEDSDLIEKIEEFKESLNKTQLNCSILQDSLELGSQFIINNQRQQGNFNYEYDFVNQIQSTNDNEVRQAGALWGISLLFQQLHTSTLRDAFLKGINFFKAHTNQDETSKQWIAYPDEDDYGSTGTIALVSLSIIDFLRSSPDISSTLQTTLQNDLEHYLNFLLSLRMENGLFHQNYYLSNGTGFGSPSPYSDGEALLAFCKAYNYQDRTDLKNIIIETAYRTYQNHIKEALEIDSDSDTTKGFFQWGIMSYYEMLQTDWKNIENYSTVIISLADWMIDVHKTLERTRNTGYAYEGIIHAYIIAEEQQDNYHIKKFKNVIDAGLYKLTTWQVNGPIPNEYLQNHSTSDPLAVGGIMNHKQEPFLRIDVTQHQMHAIILALNHVYDCSKTTL